MRIESAIKMLEEEKEKGTQSVFIAYWTADWFGREDDEQWEEDVETAERKTDLSHAHADISACLEMIEENNRALEVNDEN